MHNLVTAAILSAVAVTIALVMVVERRPGKLARWRVRTIQALVAPICIYLVAADKLFPDTRWLASIEPLIVLPTPVAQLLIYVTGLRGARSRAGVPVACPSGDSRTVNHGDSGEIESTSTL